MYPKKWVEWGRHRKQWRPAEGDYARKGGFKKLLRKKLGWIGNFSPSASRELSRCPTPQTDCGDGHPRVSIIELIANRSDAGPTVIDRRLPKDDGQRFHLKENPAAEVFRSGLYSILPAACSFIREGLNASNRLYRI